VVGFFVGVRVGVLVATASIVEDSLRKKLLASEAISINAKRIDPINFFII
jgi:hypothetical protein